MDIKSWIDEVNFYDQVAKEHIRLLLYGEAGSGKTTFAGTFPRPFFLDSDKGGRTLKDKKIPFLALRRGDRVFDICYNVLTRIEKKEPPFDKLEIDTIVFDSLTSLADMLIVESMVYPSPGSPPQNPDIVKASWDNYSQLQNRLKHLLKYSQDLGLNVVATAGVKLERDEILGSFIGKPNIVGGYRDLVSHDFDSVFYLECVDVGRGKPPKYVAHTSKYRYFEAKSRDGMMGVIESPAYERLWGLDIEEQKNKACCGTSDGGIK